MRGDAGESQVKFRQPRFVFRESDAFCRDGLIIDVTYGRVAVGTMAKSSRLISYITVALVACPLAPLLVPAVLALGPPIGTVVLVIKAFRYCHGRLHLSSLLILVVLASALMGLNLVQHSDIQRIANRYPSPHNRDLIFPIKAYGWPFAVHKEIDSNDIEELKIVQKDELAQSALHRPPFIDITLLIWDVLLAVSVVTLVVLFCERQIRKREARKAPFDGARSLSS